ncbi:MAG: helix-turn-helix domain-containing protein [Candidatus Zixiibacteriota bacterium]|nr:MAG: helix-turn-helix domain-containing protein [candidate division Zixibacteria bacterium]
MSESSKIKEYYTTTQAAKILSVSPDTVLKWVRAGKIKSRRTLGGHFRIPASEVEFSAVKEAAAAKHPAPAAEPLAYQYCWEYLAGSGEIKPECRECLTYRSRSRRCYELRDLPDGLGCLRMFCQTSCQDCDYYNLVNGQGVTVLILSENPAIIRNRNRLEESGGLHLKFAESEYECATLIQKFRPDYVVLDCAFGRKRTSMICMNLFNDPRIPVPRIILASKIKKLKDYCDKEVFGWIKKPFAVEQLEECIQGAEATE